MDHHPSKHAHTRIRTHTHTHISQHPENPRMPNLIITGILLWILEHSCQTVWNSRILHFAVTNARAHGIYCSLMWVNTNIFGQQLEQFNRINSTHLIDPQTMRPVMSERCNSNGSPVHEPYYHKWYESTSERMQIA